jgi:hypothetical protein
LQETSEQILKFVRSFTDTGAVTVVMRIQRALSGNSPDTVEAAFAALDTAIDVDTITFHPELMVRWDDESAHDSQAACDRAGRMATRPALRSARR